MTGLTLEHFFVLTGLFIGAVALRIIATPAHPRRWGSATFWLLIAVAVGAGKFLPDELVGWGLLAMGALVAAKQVAVPAFGNSEQAEIGAARFGHGLIWPILLVPAVAIVGSFAVGPQVALGIGCGAGAAAALLGKKGGRQKPGGGG